MTQEGRLKRPCTTDGTAKARATAIRPPFRPNGQRHRRLLKQADCFEGGNHVQSIRLPPTQTEIYTKPLLFITRVLTTTTNRIVQPSAATSSAKSICLFFTGSTLIIGIAPNIDAWVGGARIRHCALGSPWTLAWTWYSIPDERDRQRADLSRQTHCELGAATTYPGGTQVGSGFKSKWVAQMAGKSASNSDSQKGLSGPSRARSPRLQKVRIKDHGNARFEDLILFTKMANDIGGCRSKLIALKAVTVAFSLQSIRLSTKKLISTQVHCYLLILTRVFTTTTSIHLSH